MAQPKIRLKGFSGEWGDTILGEITDIHDGVHQTPDYQDKGIMFLSVEDISTLTSNKYISIEAYERDYKIKPEKGDILMTRIGDVGTTNVIETDEEIAYYVSLALLKPKNFNSHYISYTMQSKRFQSALRERTLTTAIPQKINKNEIGKIPLIITTNIIEQRAIASYFRCLDSLISTTSGKIESLKQMKQASLQSMFPQSGEKKPKVRFKGFSGEWEETLVKEICHINTGKSNTQDQVDNGRFPFFIRSDKPVRSNRFLYDTEAVITIGDGNIGRVFHYIKGKFDLHQRCYMMSQFDSTVVPTVVPKYFYS